MKEQQNTEVKQILKTSTRLMTPPLQDTQLLSSVPSARAPRCMHMSNAQVPRAMVPVAMAFVECPGPWCFNIQKCMAWCTMLGPWSSLPWLDVRSVNHYKKITKQAFTTRRSSTHKNNLCDESVDGTKLHTVQKALFRSQLQMQTNTNNHKW